MRIRNTWLVQPLPIDIWFYILRYSLPEVKLLSHVQLFETPWTGILQARILEWVAFPSPGDLPNLGIKPRYLALQEDSLPAEPQGRLIYLAFVIASKWVILKIWSNYKCYLITREKCVSQFSSVTLVMSYSLQPLGLQHSRLLCPSLTPRACSNSCPSHQ